MKANIRFIGNKEKYNDDPKNLIECNTIKLQLKINYKTIYLSACIAHVQGLLKEQIHSVHLFQSSLNAPSKVC